jgi:hypothetical protein
MPSRSRVPAPIVAVVAWLLPGAGYWLIGQRARGTTIGITILLLYILGIFISGIRVIEVPGYDANGFSIRVGRHGQRVHAGSDEGGWVLTSGGLIGEVANKPWYIPQLLAGPITLISSGLSVQAAQRGYSRSHARLVEIGTLYTAIAGMLNLLAIIDAAHRASLPEEVA